jgi:hypothetical protein
MTSRWDKSEVLCSVEVIRVALPLPERTNSVGQLREPTIHLIIAVMCRWTGRKQAWGRAHASPEKPPWTGWCLTDYRLDGPSATELYSPMFSFSFIFFCVCMGSIGWMDRQGMRYPSKPLPPGRPPSRLLIHSALTCDMIMQPLPPPPSLCKSSPGTQTPRLAGNRAQGTGHRAQRLSRADTACSFLRYRQQLWLVALSTSHSSHHRVHHRSHHQNNSDSPLRRSSS